jgi:hypothetical protein
MPLLFPLDRGRVSAAGRCAALDEKAASPLISSRRPRLTAGRTSGPVFLGQRRPGPARTAAAADTCK